MNSSIRQLTQASVYACLLGFALVLTGVSYSHGATDSGTAPAKMQGAGRLALPVQSSLEMREYAFGCVGCMWNFTSPCNVVFGSADQECEVRDVVCSDGQLLRIWVLAPESSWKDFGLACFPKTGPVFLRAIQSQVKRDLVESLPEVSFECSPKSGAVEALPFECRSSARLGWISRQWEVKGMPIRIVLKPRLTWQVVGDSPTNLGNSGRTSFGPTLSHVFTNRGRYQVVHRAMWAPTLHLPALSSGVRFPEVVQRAHLGVFVGTINPVLAAEGE